MIAPTPGIVYKFTFKPGYTAFDGTYRLVEIMTFDEFISQGGDILAEFFTPCSKTEADIASDLDTIRASKIYKFQVPGDLNTGEIKYAPDAYLDKVPDHNVKKYQDVGLVAHIGITDDPDTLQFITDNLNEHFKCALGINPEVKFMSLSEVYLTKDEYNDILKERELSAKKVISYYSENIRLQKLLSQAETLNNAYEEKIKELIQDYNRIKEQYEPTGDDGG